MRTGNLSTLSARDYEALKQRREWERQYEAAETDKQNRAAYREYLETIKRDQQRVAPAFWITPLTYESWSSYLSKDDPIEVRGLLATTRALAALTAKEERKQQEAVDAEVHAGKRDKAFQIPESAKSLRMSAEKAKVFQGEEAERFVANTLDYYPTRKNREAILDYLRAQDVRIANEECFASAWRRLRELGIVEEREPAPTPEPSSPEPAPPEPLKETELVDGFDPETGAPRRFTQREIWNMSSQDCKKAFRMWNDGIDDRRPRFTRGYYGQ